MKKDEVLEVYKKTTIALEELKNTDNIFVYKTEGKYLPTLGSIKEFGSVEKLTEAKKIIDEHFANESDSKDEGLGDLGIEGLEDLSDETKKVVPRYLGLTKTTWYEDLKTKGQELVFLDRRGKLKTLKDKLSVHLSVEDNFSLDFEGLDVEKILG